MRDEAGLERLAGEITELAAHIAAATCRWLLLVAEFDRREGHLHWGMARCEEWLAWCCSLSPETARQQVRVARRLADLPLVRDSFARGELTYSKVRALVRIATAENERELVELGRHATAAQLERVVRGYRRSAAVALDQANQAYADRYLSLSWDDDGSLLIRGRLAPEEGAVVMRALEQGRELLRADARSAAEATGAGARTPDGYENGSAAPEPAAGATARGTANADALALMAETLLARGAAERPAGERCELVVHVDAGTLPAHDHDPHGACHVEEGPGLHPETARRLGCDASLVRIVEHDGRPLSVGRKRRTISPALRRALDARDGGCRFPGCNRRHGEGHHIRHWAHGGETKLSNLVKVCKRHHRLLHEGRYTVERDGPGLRFRRPDGQPIPTVPHPRRGDESRLRSLNHQDGATPDPETCMPISRGGRIDYGMAVEALLHKDGLLGLDKRVDREALAACRNDQPLVE